MPPQIVCLIDTISISLWTIRESHPCIATISLLIFSDCYLNPFLHQPPPPDVPQFVHSQPSIWTAKRSDEVFLPCTITNAVMGVTYKRVWRLHPAAGAGDSSYTILPQNSKYSFSGNHLVIMNVSEEDTNVSYTCAIKRLNVTGHNNLQGHRPSSGSMQIKLLSKLHKPQAL